MHIVTRYKLLIIGLFLVISSGLFLKYNNNQLFYADSQSEIDKILSSNNPRYLTNILLDINKSVSVHPEKRGDALLVAKKRKDIMLDLMQQNPSQFITQSMTFEQQTGLGSNIRQYVEHSDVQTGTLIETISDNLKQNKSENYYYLDTKNDGHIKVFFTTPPRLVSGSVVELKGIALDDSIVVQPKNKGDYKILQEVQALTPSLRKMAVILVNFSNDNTQPWTLNQMKTNIYGSSNSVNHFYNEISYGQYGFSGSTLPQGDFYGYYTISSPSYICDPYTWDDQAEQAAASNGFNSTNYDNIIIAFPNAPSCGWAGLGTVGGSPSVLWINGTTPYVDDLDVVAHELGHNFGARHSSFYYCTDAYGSQVTLSNNCTSAGVQFEYGDTYDIMGNINIGHMNVYQKFLSSFLGAGNIQTITTSGTYTLDQLEQNSSGVKSLRILRQTGSNGVNQYYYLEYRRPFGYDAYSGSMNKPNIDGVIVRLVNNTATQSYSPSNSLLLDMLPNVSLDSSLKLNQTFTDTPNNITLKTTAISDTSASVQITMNNTPVCTRSNPTLTISPTSSEQVPAGTPVQYLATVTNNDSPLCADSVYSFHVVNFANWNVTLNPTTLSIAHGQSKTMQLTITSPTDAPNGNTDFWIYAVATNDTIEYESSLKNFTYRIDNGAVDTTPPIGTISINKRATATNSNNITLNIQATDNISGLDTMRFSNNNSQWSAWTTYATSKSWDITNTAYGGTSTQGTKKIYLQLKDKSGNSTTSEISTSIIFDTTPPTASVVLAGGAISTRQKSISVTMSASDSLSGIGAMRFSNNNIFWTSWLDFKFSNTWDITSPTYGGNTKNAKKTVYIQFKDKAENILALSRSITYDSIGPSGTIKINISYIRNPLVKLYLSASDSSGLSTMRFSNNNSLWSSPQAYTTSKNWNIASGFGGTSIQGRKTVYVQYLDKLGNISSIISITKVYDKVAPTGKIYINRNARSTKSRYVTLNLSAKDITSGISKMHFSNNGTKWSKWRKYTTSFYRWNLTTHTFGGKSAKGKKCVYIQFTDKAGNTTNKLKDCISYK